MTALFAIPLASLGFVQLVDIVRSWCAEGSLARAGGSSEVQVPAGGHPPSR